MLFSSPESISINLYSVAEAVDFDIATIVENEMLKLGSKQIIINHDVYL